MTILLIDYLSCVARNSNDRFTNTLIRHSERIQMKSCNGMISILCVVHTSMWLTGTDAAEKPNVLYIIADDLNTSLSGFGHPQCKTPNLDRLARRGVKFANMHCQYPVCGASRASIMSGTLSLYKSHVGEFRHVARKTTRM